MASSSRSNSDTVFHSLPHYVQRRIDRAFDSVASPKGAAEPKEGLDSGGGFVVEDEVLAGGFLPEDTGPQINQPSEISMSSVPSALQYLDLPPDDEQVLSVFRNAASGWSSSTSKDIEGNDMSGGTVSRDDWRAVCAVLLEHHKEEYEDDSDGSALGNVVQENEEDPESDDQYLGSGASDNDSDGEYVEGPAATGSRRRTRGRPAKSVSPSPSFGSPSPRRRTLTARQQQTALAAFALFFPSVPESEIPNQKIMIKDIQRVAKLLGERIKAEEVCQTFVKNGPHQ